MYYVPLSALAVIGAFLTGQARFGSSCAADVESTDCDVGVVSGAMWALMAFGFCVVVIVVCELCSGSRSQRSTS